MLSQYHHIAPDDLNIFTVVDDPQAATNIIVNFRESKGRSGLDLPPGMKKTRS